MHMLLEMHFKYSNMTLEIVNNEELEIVFYTFFLSIKLLYVFSFISPLCNQTLGWFLKISK
jgi:hypothetical protein